MRRIYLSDHMALSRISRRRWPLPLPFFTLITLLLVGCRQPVTTQAPVSASASRPVVLPDSAGHVPRLDAQLRQHYRALGDAAQGLRFAVFEQAMTGYLNLRQQGLVPRQRLAIVDFDLPSTEKRLWVLDVSANQVLYRTLVAHGNQSGQLQASHFSNTVNSHMSSLGFYVAGETYVGKHGRSLRLSGLDEGFNSNAAARAIVVHGADYVSENFIKQTGRLGRSQGCPALPLDLYEPIIDSLKGGAGLFMHKSEAGYSSPYLDEQKASAAYFPAA